MSKQYVHTGLTNDKHIKEIMPDGYQHGPKVFVGGRRSGKTTAVIEYLNANPDAVVIVATGSVRDMYTKQGIDQSRVILPFQMHNGYKQIAVDDAEWVLSTLLGSNIKFMAMTSDSATVAYTHIGQMPVEQEDIPW